MRSRRVSTLAAVLMTASLLVGTSACSEKTPVAVATVTPSAEPTVKAVFVKAAKTYRQVLTKPAEYLKLPEGLTAQKVSYALDLLSDTEVPRLILHAQSNDESWNGIEYVRVLSVSPDTDEVQVLDTDLAIGAAGAGGFRGTISRSSLGKGLLYTTWSSGTGEGTITRITADGTGFKEEEVCQGQVALNPCLPRGEATAEIAWVDSSDTSALDQLEKGEWKPEPVKAEPEAQETASSGTPLSKGGPLSKGRVEDGGGHSSNGDPVFTGTVRIVDYEGVLRLQNQADPNPGAASVTPGPYALLVFDQPQEVTAINGDAMGSSTRTASMLLLGMGDSTTLWSKYDGQHISVSHPSSETWWPSDTGLPLGEPRADGAPSVVD